ncbi:hypothetical protein QBC38DRAFT_485686 [Podospora fimiseda]|uniref:BTB domain-containing protein n=1 Tax=Podospora fimiseda TaxID=252190 RepID=A0AAN7GQ30_9PEZI|nr:hypothetical protein QBC38DRAFT_485686 [Podospora fimiseda]
MSEVILDTDGDLFLRIGSDLSPDSPVTFRVDPFTLRRTSGVFKSMLFGPWAESKPLDNSPWIVDLPEDEPTAFEALLGIMHNRYKLVPVNMTMDLLFDILVICDKYNMTYVITPWANSWMRDVEAQCKVGETKSPKMAYIAWELGNEVLFAGEVRKFIFESYTMDDHDEGEGGDGGKLFWDGSGEAAGQYDLTGLCHLGPPDLMKRVIELRLSLIQVILGFLQNEIKLRTGPGTGGIPAKHACIEPGYYSAGFRCDDIILGGIWRGILTNEKLNGIDSKNASQVCLSANVLAVEFRGVFKHLYTYGDSHRDCIPAAKFEKFIQNIWGHPQWKDFLRQADKDRMAHQREKIQASL